MTPLDDHAASISSKDYEPRVGRAELTRREILKAAREVFREHGYADANVGLIIDRCGVSRGAFYYHFRNKDDAFGALAKEAVKSLEYRLFPPGADRSPFERIYIANYEYLQGFREVADIFWNLNQAANTSPSVRALQKKMWDTPVSRVERHLRNQHEQGKTRPLDPATTAAALCAMLDAFCVRWFSLRHIEIPESEVARVAHDLSVIWYLAVYGSSEALDG